MTSEVDKTMKELNQNYGLPTNIIRRLIVPNPMMPIVYGTLKVHKPERNMRLIIRYTNSSVDKISSYVVQEFNKLNYPKG